MKKNKRALITGASSGIGLELAKKYAADGYDLLIVSRREEVLKCLADEISEGYGVSVDFFAVDLSVPGSAEKIYEYVDRKALNVDVLVNNAGFGNYGFFPETDLQADIELLQLNIVALTHLSKLFVKGMLAKGGGSIVNVASVAGFMPGPYMNTYFASKNYVVSFSLALRNELKDKNINVNCICPGPTPTNFGKRAHYKHKLKRTQKMPLSKVVDIAYSEVKQNKSIIVPGWKNKVLVFISRFFPRDLLAITVRKASGY